MDKSAKKYKNRLKALLILFSIGFVVFAIIGYTLFQQIIIKGNLYNNITQNKDLIADILPPPNNLMEAHINFYEIIIEEDSLKQQQKIKKAGTIQQTYVDKANSWHETLNDKKALELFIRSNKKADEYFQIQQKILQNHQWSNDVFLNELESKYSEHLLYIDKLQRYLQIACQNDEVMAKRKIAFTILTYTVFSIFILAIIITSGLLVSKAIVKEISERIKANIKLNESEEKYRILSDNAIDGISLLEDNRITYISDGYLKMLGYGKEDMLGISLEDVLNLTHKDDLDFLRETITNAYKNQTKQHSYECRIRTISGKYIWIENRTRIEYFENGKHKRSIIHTRDITERKEAEKQKNYLSAIIENTENICVVKDLDLRVIATNESFAKAAGKNSVKDLIGKTDAEIFEVSADAEPIKGYMLDDLNARKLKKGEKILREEIIIYPDKSIKTLLTAKFPIYDSDNKLIATANISTDITDLKNAENKIIDANKAIEEQRIFLLETQKAGKIGSIKFSFAQNDWQSSEMLDEIFGIDKDYNKTLESWEKLIHPEDRNTMSNYLQHQFIEEKKEFNKEYRIIRANDKQLRWVHGYGKPILDNENNVIGVYGTAQDITKRKLAELVVKESNFLLKEFSKIAKIGGWKIDMATKELSWTDETYRIYEIEKDYIPTVEYAISFFDEESIPVIAKAVDDAIQYGTPFDEDLYIITAKGNRKVVKAKGEAIKNDKGEMIEIRGIFQDITQQKQADLAKIESEKRYKELFDNLIDEVHVWDIVKDENGEIKTWKLSDVNPSALKAWGKTKKQVIGKTADEIFKDNITENFMPVVQKIFTSGKPISWEHDFPPTNQFLSMTSFPLGTRFISTGRDITKEKAAVEALKESEERYAMIFERTKNPLVITNLKGYVVQFNEEAAKQLGYTKEEYAGLHISQIDVNDNPEKVTERMEKTKKEGAVFFETQHRAKNGQIRDIMVSAALIKIKDEHFNLVVFNDITPIKQAHKTILEQNQLLEEQEEELKQTLETQEVLLKEVHHRVKNNLQTVSSLLYQQKKLSKDPKITQALNESMNRVSSMALIHQYIYKSSNLKHLNIKQYISELVRKLKESYQEHKQNIQLQMEIDDIEFDIDKTIPVALMLNEILSNIFKYAFTDKESGKINILLKKQDAAKVKLLVSDNGIGFPENFDAEKSKTLGMYLIVNFAKLQLAGDLTISSKPNKGVKYEIIF